jgi:hypothetical protein
VRCLARAIRVSIVLISSALIGTVLIGLGICAVPSAGALAAEPIEQLERAVPRRGDTWDAARVQVIATAAHELDEWAAGQAWPSPSPNTPSPNTASPNNSPPTDAQVVVRLERLVEAIARIDRCTGLFEELRSDIAGPAVKENRREPARQFLFILATLGKLQGRLRYMLHHAIENATYSLDASQPSFAQLLELLLRHRSQAGAEEMAYMLFDPDPAEGIRPFPASRKIECLRLLAATGATGALEDLAQFLAEPNVPPELMIEAISAIRQIGLPQDLRRGGWQDEPVPPVYAAQLREILSRLVMADNAVELEQRRVDLLTWATQRTRHGVTGETFRWGINQFRGGDWILVNQLSPFRHATDLSPGLFFHAGIVTEEIGRDQKRRFLAVELPEKGDLISATNIEAFLSRASSFTVLRHVDPQVSRDMSTAARDLIGNESQFDPSLRTDRVARLRGQSLRGQLIHSCSGGLLLLCAQSARRSREELFPMLEQPANECLVANLGQLGVPIGPQIVSPTGALFSSQMQIVGRGEPRYEPTDEIQQAILDHFLHRLCAQPLTASRDLNQTLAQHLTQVTRSAPWLSRALARADDESAYRELEAAARAAALFDTVETTAQRNARACLAAIAALQPQSGRDTGDVDRALADSRMLSRHQTLLRDWQDGKLNPWQLRSELVEHYIQAGTHQLDRLFFQTR